MNHHELSVLFEKLVNNQCSKEEADRILQLLDDEENGYALGLLISQQMGRPVSEPAGDEAKKRLNMRLEAILQAHPPPVRRKIKMIWFAAAAAAVIAILVGGYLLLQPRSQPVAKVQPIVAPIVAGSNKAILTLSDGRKINLSDTSNGDLAIQSSMVVRKSADGVLEYTAAETAQQSIALPMFNTITIPRGGQYEVVLPDGTKVWLNSVSSLKYPARFEGEQRLVELTGEAYFEVAKGLKPFVVKSDRQQIEVLGTAFNVNAYEDESHVTTTLVNGAVRVAGAVLKPGQQAEVAASSVKVSEANMETALAWRKGMFQFEEEDIRQVMRKIARWYDVEVSYEGDMRHKAFTGGISRFQHVSEVLKMLQITGTATFTIQGRKIIVH